MQNFTQSDSFVYLLNYYEHLGLYTFLIKGFQTLIPKMF